MAWLYQWTAAGLQREGDTPVPLSPGSRASRRTVDRWIIVMLAAAVVLLLADKFLFRNRAGTVGGGGVADKAIAVLPFLNMSSDKENDYVADGVSEQIPWPPAAPIRYPNRPAKTKP